GVSGSDSPAWASLRRHAAAKDGMHGGGLNTATPASPIILMSTAFSEPTNSPSAASPEADHALDYRQLADAVLAGHAVTHAESLAILRSPNADLLAVLDAAFRVRRAHFGLSVQLYFLMNAKSGLCPEDCNYCSQSK